MTIRSYADTIQACLRDLAECHPELLFLRGGSGDVGGEQNGVALRCPERAFTAEGVAGVLGAAVGLALTGRRALVTLAPAGAALGTLQRLGVDLAPSVGGEGVRGARCAVHGLPLVVRVPLEGVEPTLGHFCGLRGLRVALPASATDAAELLRHAVGDAAPWLYLEDRRLRARAGDLASPRIPLGTAAIRREGRDLTLIAFSTMSIAALRAADVLADRGIEAEVLDPRTLAPFDMESVVRSVWRTHRALIVDEGETLMGPTLAAGISAAAFDELDAPVEVVRVEPRRSLPDALAHAATAIASHSCWMMGRSVQQAPSS